MKKRWTCGILAVILLLSLTACVQQPDLTTMPPTTNPSGTMAATDPIATTAPTSGAYVTVEKPDRLPAEGWHKTDFVTTEPYVFAEGGCYYVFNSCLCFLDTNSGYTAFLCSRPTCGHGEAESFKELRECDAYIDSLIILMFCHNDTLYYGVHEDYGIQLYARDLDGTNMRKVAILGSEYISQETAYNLRDWCVCGEYLYCTANIDRIEISGENYTHTGKPLFAFTRLNLTNGREEELISTDKETMFLLGVNDGMALLSMRENVAADEFEDFQEYSDYIDQLPLYLRLWSEEAGGVATLIELNREKAWRSIGFAMGQLHLRGEWTNEGCAYDFATGEVVSSKLPDEITNILNDNYGVVNAEGFYNLKTGEYFSLSYEDMTLPEGVDRFDAGIRCIGSDGIIVLESFSQKKDEYYTGVLSQEAYIPFSEIENGMQLSDRRIFLRKTFGESSKLELIQPEG